MIKFISGTTESLCSKSSFSYERSTPSSVNLQCIKRLLFDLTDCAKYY